MPSRTLKNSCSGLSSPARSSASSHWWDNVFEAADLANYHQIIGGESRGTPGPPLTTNHVEAGLKCETSVTDVFPTARNRGAHQEVENMYPSRSRIVRAKLALNSGKEHVTVLGKIRKARHLKKPCSSNCQRCAVPRLSDTERQHIFQTFWSLRDHERQWSFIYGSVKSQAIKRRCSVVGSKGAKTSTRCYSFKTNGEMRRVCKTMFKNTLCICDSWIDSALNHFSSNGFVGDKRGKRKCTADVQSRYSQIRRTVVLAEGK